MKYRKQQGGYAVLYGCSLLHCAFSNYTVLHELLTVFWPIVAIIIWGWRNLLLGGGRLSPPIIVFFSQYMPIPSQPVLL